MAYGVALAKGSCQPEKCRKKGNFGFWVINLFLRIFFLFSIPILLTGSIKVTKQATL